MLASSIVRHLVFSALLILISALWAFNSLTKAHAQQLTVLAFTGEPLIDSKPPPDGTIITGWIDGGTVARNRTKGGEYTVRAKQNQGRSF